MTKNPLIAAAFCALAASTLPAQQSSLFQSSNLGQTNFFGNSTKTATAESDDEWLDRAEKERRAQEARQQFETTVNLLTEQKGELEYAQQIADQAKNFSAEFLKLDLDAPGFVDKFEGLLDKYPLAVEDPFTAKLIRKGELTARRADPERAQARLDRAREQARKALEARIGALKAENPAASLEDDRRYNELKEALKRIEDPTSP